MAKIPIETQIHLRTAEFQKEMEKVERVANGTYHAYQRGFEAGQAAGIELGLNAGENRGKEALDATRKELATSENHCARLAKSIDYWQTRHSEAECAVDRANQARDRAEAHFYGYLTEDLAAARQRARLGAAALMIVQPLAMLTVVYWHTLGHRLAGLWATVRCPQAWALAGAIVVALGLGLLAGRRWDSARPRRQRARRFREHLRASQVPTCIYCGRGTHDLFGGLCGTCDEQVSGPLPLVPCGAQGETRTSRGEERR